MFKVMLTDCNEIINLTPSSQLSKQQQRNEDLEVIIHDKLTLKKVCIFSYMWFLCNVIPLKINQYDIKSYFSKQKNINRQLPPFMSYIACMYKFKNIIRHSLNLFAFPHCLLLVSFVCILFRNLFLTCHRKQLFT